MKTATGSVIANAADEAVRAATSSSSSSSTSMPAVRLFRCLMPRWYRGFGYQVAGPMRRDFSVVLAQHDNDFEHALVAAESGEVYTSRVHAGDLAVRSSGTHCDCWIGCADLPPLRCTLTARPAFCADPVPRPVSGCRAH